MLRHRKLLLLLLLAVAIPATAQSFGFSVGTSTPATCLAIGDTSYRVAANGSRPDYTVRIDPGASAPDLRIQLSETADAADFVVVDDGDAPPRCPRSPFGLKSVKLDATAATPDLVIGFATSTVPADYRIFVRSRTIAPETAAALFAAAHVPPRMRVGKAASIR